MNNFSKQILIGLAALAAVAYLGLQLSLNIGTMIDIDYATYATANDDITTDAYFFREETVLTSQAEPPSQKQPCQTPTALRERCLFYLIYGQPLKKF